MIVIKQISASAKTA